MDKLLPAEAIGFVDQAIIDLLGAGLDVQDPKIAGSFVEAVTAQLSGPGRKRPFPAILAEAVKTVKDAQEKAEAGA